MDVEEASPLLVAIIVIAVLVIVQPLSGTLAGISLNWVGVILAAVGGFVGTFGS
jgi:hypothetical protein